MSRRYQVGFGEAETAEAALAQAIAAGPPPPGANLALLYASDHFADDFPGLVEAVKLRCGIDEVVGTVGMGIVDRGGERFDKPCLSLLTMALPKDSFHSFGPFQMGWEEASPELIAWTERQALSLALVSADPRTSDLPAMLGDLAEGGHAYCLGGLTASRRGQAAAGTKVSHDPGLSGVFLGDSIPVSVGLTQSCVPLTEAMAITAADGQVVKEIEGQPALNAVIDLIERDFEGDFAGAWPRLHPAFPVLGAERSDYLVRDFVGLDPDKGWLAVGELVEPGRRILFCRRDPEAAATDLARMADVVLGRAKQAPQAAVYVSCVARGPQLFGAKGAELKILRERLGDIPITGFYAAGEIAGERLYGYTGVLALLS